MTRSKSIEFRGSSFSDLRRFPESAKRDAGHQLFKVQHGREPDDWKPMPGIGKGVQEIRIWEAAGTFRVVYVATFADVVYVLHCFKKTTQRTSKPDVDLATARFRSLLKEFRG